MARAILLILAILSFGTSGYAYFAAVHRTRDPAAFRRILMWGPMARRDAWTAETRRYRTVMRWGSGLGLLFYLAFLTVAP